MTKIVFGPQIPAVGRFASVDAIKMVANDAESLGFGAIFMRDHVEL